MLILCLTLTLFPLTLLVHYLLFPYFANEDSREIDEAAKELKHMLLQNTMDKQMNQLNKSLE